MNLVKKNNFLIILIFRLFEILLEWSKSFLGVKPLIFSKIF